MVMTTRKAAIAIQRDNSVLCALNLSTEVLSLVNMASPLVAVVEGQKRLRNGRLGDRIQAFRSIYCGDIVAEPVAGLFRSKMASKAAFSKGSNLARGMRLCGSFFPHKCR
jgi:hypothetical protein